jgi:hypothetical protein
MCVVKVINTHMRDVEGNRFFTSTHYCQRDRQMDELAERKKGKGERERETKVKD